MRISSAFIAASLVAVLTAAPASFSHARAAEAATADDVSIGNPLALTIYLPVRNEAAAEAEARAMQTPGNASYHRFSSVSDFVARYGATENQLQNLEAVLAGLGFTIQYVYPNHLAVEAVSSAQTAESVFGLSLKRFTRNGRTGIASTTPARIPQALSGMILGVAGFNTLTHPHAQHAIAAVRAHRKPFVASKKLVGGTPGDYLPADFAKFYDVDPLYKRGVTGRNSTIGIVTLNDFETSDAYAFWKAIGLNVSQSRITKVNVDGGETAVTNNPDGEGETDLDVEQSGSIAPDAKLRVYIAPNISDANFINAFEAAASENVAQTLSSSWGEAEGDYFYNLATKTTGDSFLFEAYHAAFLEMALQGQTLFIASGDSGSFDTVDECPFFGTPSKASPTCNAPYAIDAPGNDPLVTAAGGTTLPWSANFGGGLHLAVAYERAWSWQYLADEAAREGRASLLPLAEVFSTGDGGGVSSYWNVPWYQLGIPGVSLTKPGQRLTENSGSGSVLQYTFPANFAGRNVPDISTNADPESGYQYIEEGQVGDFLGGTSFVAPQLNGVTALLVQTLGGRVGQLNPALYQLGSRATTDLARGDNWGYASVRGYDDAVGTGVLDAAKLVEGLTALRSASR